MCHKVESFLVKSVFLCDRFLSAYPTDLYSIYYLEGWFKFMSSQKLLSLEITLSLKSFQCPSDKPHMRNREERDNRLHGFCNHRSLTNLAVKILT